jgi:hypothetical protein
LRAVEKTLDGCKKGKTRRKTIKKIEEKNEEGIEVRD